MDIVVGSTATDCEVRSIEDSIVEIYRYKRLINEPILDCLMLENILRKTGHNQQAEEVKDQVRSKLLEIETSLNSIIKSVDPHPVSEEAEDEPTRRCSECDAELGPDETICPECGAENPLDDEDDNNA